MIINIEFTLKYSRPPRGVSVLQIIKLINFIIPHFTIVFLGFHPKVKNDPISANPMSVC